MLTNTSTQKIRLIQKKLDKIKSHQNIQTLSRAVSDTNLFQRTFYINLKKTVLNDQLKFPNDFTEEKIKEDAQRQQISQQFIVHKPKSRVKIQNYYPESNNNTSRLKEKEEKINELEALLLSRTRQNETLGSELEKLQMAYRKLSEVIFNKYILAQEHSNLAQAYQQQNENCQLLEKGVREKDQKLNVITETMKQLLAKNKEGEERQKQLIDFQSNVEINDMLRKKNHDLEFEFKSLQSALLDLEQENKSRLALNKQLKSCNEAVKQELLSQNQKADEFEKIILKLSSKVEEQNRTINKINSQNILVKIKSILPQMLILKAKTKYSLECKHCGEIAVKPITVIPCAHIYCFECKQGYCNGKCQICGSKIPLEAIYENELVIEIIEVFQLLSQGIDILENLLI